MNAYCSNMLRVNEIHLNDGDILEDKYVLIHGNFIIVADTSEDCEPNFYNVATVSKMLGVTDLKKTMRISR